MEQQENFQNPIDLFVIYDHDLDQEKLSCISVSSFGKQSC